MTDLTHAQRFASATPPAGDDEHGGGPTSERLDGARATLSRGRAAIERLGRVVRGFRAEDLQNSGGE